MDFETLTKAINKEKIIIFFHADWCGGCKLISPKVTQIAHKLDFILIKITEDSELEEKFEVDYYPHLIVANRGDVKTYLGVTEINELYESLI